MNNKTAILEYTSSLIGMLCDATHEDLTENDLDSLKEVLSDLKETIQDVEFSLFVAPNDKEFIEADKELSKL